MEISDTVTFVFCILLSGEAPKAVESCHEKRDEKQHGNGQSLSFERRRGGHQELYRSPRAGDDLHWNDEVGSVAGDLFYSSENDGLKSFVVGEGGVETGLDEAMSYLHRGDVAKLIIPFHLAYGLHGDDNRIPEYATLVYTIKIIDNQ